MPEGQTPQAQAIIDLSAVVFAVATLIFLGVVVTLGLAVWRFRDRGDREPARFSANPRLEVAWTVVPSLVLAVIFVMMLGTMQSLTAAPANAHAVRVVGHQWWWEFVYGDATTANEMHLPIDRTVQLEITSVDVIHSFWVPELAGKRDAVPGQTQHLTITPKRAGVYRGACAEFCGQEHAWMLIRVVVEPQAEFDAWLAGQRAPAVAASTDQPGARVFLASTCVSCHTIRGTSARGTAGPDLTHLAGRTTLGAGVAPNDVGHLAAWIADANQLKPGVLMPRFSLGERELRDLVAFLESLR